MSQPLPMMAVLVDASASGAGRSRQGHVETPTETGLWGRHSDTEGEGVQLWVFSFLFCFLSFFSESNTQQKESGK